MKINNLLFISVMTITFLSSCGGTEKKEEEKKDLTLCECNDLKEKYPSKEDAEKEAGKETIEKCVELFETATDEDFEKCK
jgi:hypothetical protein